MKNNKYIKRLRGNPLIDLLFTVEGNPKALLFLEPLWGIPYYLIAPFATLYIRSYNISDLQIGSMFSIFMIVQVITGFFAGPLADKYGRKKITIFGDLFGWSVSMLIFAVSNNYFLFLLAFIFNSFEQVNQTAWTCLLIEDAKDKDILNIHSWITIGGLVSVVFAPISGIFIENFTLVPVMKVLYVIFSLNMGLKSYITYKYCDETAQGKIKMKENKNNSILSMTKGTTGYIKRIFRDKNMRASLFIMAILSTTMMIYNTFLGIYINENLLISEKTMAFIPLIRTGVMLVFMFTIQHKIKTIKNPMLFGVLLYVLTQVALLVSPVKSTFMVIIGVVLEALSFSIIWPRKSSLETIFIEKEERARLLSLITIISLIFTTPFGTIAGSLSQIDRRLPFVLNIFLFVIAFIVILSIKEPTEAQETQ